MQYYRYTNMLNWHQLLHKHVMYQTWDHQCIHQYLLVYNIHISVNSNQWLSDQSIKTSIVLVSSGLPRSSVYGGCRTSEVNLSGAIPSVYFTVKNLLVLWTNDAVAHKDRWTSFIWEWLTPVCELFGPFRYVISSYSLWQNILQAAEHPISSYSIGS